MALPYEFAAVSTASEQSAQAELFAEMPLFPTVSSEIAATLANEGAVMIVAPPNTGKTVLLEEAQHIVKLWGQPTLSIDGGAAIEPLAESYRDLKTLREKHGGAATVFVDNIDTLARQDESIGLTNVRSVLLSAITDLVANRNPQEKYTDKPSLVAASQGTMPVDSEIMSGFTGSRLHQFDGTLSEEAVQSELSKHLPDTSTEAAIEELRLATGSLRESPTLRQVRQLIGRAISREFEAQVIPAPALPILGMPESGSKGTIHASDVEVGLAIELARRRLAGKLGGLSATQRSLPEHTKGAYSRHF